MYTLRIATTKTELEEIFQLRYRVYVAEFGINVRHFDHVNKMIMDPLDESSINIGAWCNDQLVGCVRLSFNNNDHFTEFRKALAMDEFTGVSPDKYCMATKFAVDPKHQHSRLNVLLQQFSYKIFFENNMEYCFVECLDTLINYYQKFGFKAYTGRTLVTEYGISTPMAVNIHDIDYLRAIRSPFVRVYESIMTETNIVHAKAA